MKIAFIRYKYDPYGGAERFTDAVARSLAQSGNEVHLFARQWAGSVDSGIHPHRIGGMRWPALLSYASFVFLVGRAVRRESFDLIQSNERTLCQHVYRAGDGVHARWLELRAAHQNPLRRLTIRFNPFHAFRLWLERRLFEDPRLERVIVNSEMVRGEILSRFRIPNAKICTIYNGVDLQRFHPKHRRTAGKALRRQYGVDEATPVVLFVGSGFERKGLPSLLKALALAGGSTQLWVVGKGKLHRYRALAQTLGISERIVWAGAQADTVPFYAAADWFALPTLYDPFPTVVLEALASGLPVVTTARCGAAEILSEGEEGFTIPSADRTDALAQCLKRLEDPTLREAMSVKARRRAESFPLERTLRELQALYEELLGRRVRV